MQALLVRTDGSETPINPKNGTDFNFRELQAILQVSLFELVELPGDRWLVVDESGSLKDNRIKNEFATKLYNCTRISKEEYESQKQQIRDKGFAVLELSNYDDFAIYGDVIVCDKSMIK